MFDLAPYKVGKLTGKSILFDWVLLLCYLVNFTTLLLSVCKYTFMVVVVGTLLPLLLSLQHQACSERPASGIKRFATTHIYKPSL